jgi:hypothetical protein
VATYLELKSIAGDAELRLKMEAAIGILASEIAIEVDTVPLHAARLTWAKRALTDPMQVAADMLWGVICSNAALTKSQILGATDAAIKSASATLVNLYAGS